MRIFVYEHVSGGGFLDIPLAEIVPSWFVEGAAMRDALATDFAAIQGAHVVMMNDARHRSRPLENVDNLDIENNAAHVIAFEREARAADWTVVIAPETDGMLAGLAKRVQALGGRLLGCSPRLIALAGDKHRLANHLPTHGVRAPRGTLIRFDEAIPNDVPFPVVVKPVDGAGSVGAKLVRTGDDWMQLDRNVAELWRVEEYLPGAPISVAFLCGPRGAIPLPPCAQHLSEDGRLSYRGGTAPFPGAPIALRERIQRLALRAVESLGNGLLGYVGVDMVVGKAEEDNAVIEINPRLTTSYVGLRTLCRDNLAQGMLQVARGDAPSLSFRDGPVRFTPAGEVFFHSEPIR